MIKKLDAYIVKKFLGTFFFILLIILVVSIVIDIAEKIDDFIEYKPPIGKLIFTYYGNFMIFFGNLLSPICIFLSVIYFTSRMTQNTEVVAMLTGGISFYRVLLPYIVTSILLAGASFYLNAYLVPAANQARIDFEYDYLRSKKNYFREQNIHKIINFDETTGIETHIHLFKYQPQKKRGEKFTLDRYKDNQFLQIITGDSLIWNKQKKSWRIKHNVNVMNFLPDSTFELLKPDFIDTTFIKVDAKGDTTYLLTPDDIFIKDLKEKSLPLNELTKAIELEQMRGSGLHKKMIRERLERFAFPFAAIILTLIGFSVSTKKRRGGTALQLGLGLIISFAFITLVFMGQAFLPENLAPWIGVWIPNITFLIIGLLLLRIAPK